MTGKDRKLRTYSVALSRLSPIESLNAALAELGKPWRIELVVEWQDAFVLSTNGPVPFETLAEISDQLGLDPADFGEIDDYLSPLEPWETLGGFVLKDDAPEAAAEVAVWAADKLGLTGLISPRIQAFCR